ncbi:MAG: TIGR01244 family sulfur transferase [Aestuariivita sp.]|nr:TIGR01244 family sulfur transferase [Aestuariivita sp.]
MTFHFLTEKYAVSPQITPDDVSKIKEAGFTTIICNRPDSEVPEVNQASQIRTWTESIGLKFEELPITHQTMTPDVVEQQREIVGASQGPVLAYCASGTRCSIIWALGAALHQMPIDDILAITRNAGYSLDNLRPTFEAASKVTRK